MYAKYMVFLSTADIMYKVNFGLLALKLVLFLQITPACATFKAEDVKVNTQQGLSYKNSHAHHLDG